MYVWIGGIDQWVQFGEHQPQNPVLLYLHGGPGGKISHPVTCGAYMVTLSLVAADDLAG